MMPGVETPEERRTFVLDVLLPMLKNDLRVLVESGCSVHGCGTGHQFSIALVCMVACEAVGALSARPGVRGAAARREFIEGIGGIVHDNRYGQYAGLLFE